MTAQACLSGVKATTMRSVSLFLIPAVLLSMSGCGEQRGPTVYVLEGPQTVELKASATPATVQQGETVVLHVEQRNSTKWKQVSRDELAPGQCWVYRPPVEVEEVAQEVQWEVVPEKSVRFHTEYQLDKSRVATMTVKGTIKLTPVGKVKCEEGRRIYGTTLEIEVT
jgi:hypothetical protein